MEDKVKTYGDDITKQLPDYMMNREEFTGMDGKLHNVNEFTDAFQEKTYDNYISVPEGQSITVTSVGKDGATGAVGTATRTGGSHTATEKSGADGKNAVYDLNVNLNGAIAKDGYVLKSENATLEILKRKASITGTGTQTYGGEKGKFDWKETKQENIAQGNTVFYTTSVKSGSAYTDNQKGRNTADSGTYENSVSFDSLKIKDANGNEVNIADNYDLTTTGTIDVAKAKLIVNTDGKTTTYGTVDESYTSRLDDSTKALNGDDAKKLISDLRLTYKTDAYQDNDGNGTYDRTNHVKYTSDGKDYDSYKLDVANTNTLNNYEVTVKDSTVTLERAKATVDTDKVTTDYGTVKNTYTSHFNTAVNGDNGDDLLKQLKLSYSTDAYKDADHTNNVKDGGYDLNVKANGSLTYNDYDVKVNDSNVTLNKVNLTVNPEDIHRIYGQATEVQEDAKTAYSLSGFANGDTKDTVDATNKDGKTIDQLVTVTNDVSKALKDENTHTQNASTVGYDMVTKATGDLTNYNIVIGDPKKVYLDKAELVIDTDSNSKVYGDWQGVKNDVEGAAHIRDAETAVVNGDKVSDLEKEMGLTTSSEALIKNADGTYKTNHVKDGGYAIDTKFADAITNYTVKRGAAGTETLTKAQATVDTDNVTTTYGTADKNYTSHFNTAVNGDNRDELLKQLNLSYSTDAYDKDGKPTNDVKEGGYDLIVAAKGSLTHDDYDITLKNANVTLNKAKLVIDTDSNSKVYGDWQGVKNDVEGAAHIRNAETAVVNGDKVDDLIKEMNLKTSSDALQQNTDGTYKTNHVKDGGYAITTEFSDTIKNYDVSQGTVGTETLTKTKATVDTDAVTTTYGTVNKNYTSHFNTAVNGDDPAKLLEDLKLTYTTEAYKDDTHTNDVKDGGYTLDVEKTADLDDYDVTVNGSNVILNPKAITIRNTMTQQYGSPEKTFSEATVPADQLANGDRISTKDLKFGIVSGGKYDTSLKENQAKHEGAVSADAGTYWGELTHTGGGITHEDGTDAYKNYKVTVEGDIIVTPADLTVKINDASTQYGTPFDEESGKKSYDYTVVSGNANGETKAEVKDLLGQLKNYKNAGVGDNGRATKDVGSYDITGEQDNKLTNYTVKIEDGTATITKAPLEITTKDVSVDYGTAYGTMVGKTVSLVDGLTNGDAEKASDLSYNYGNYGGGYIENNTKTNHVGGYDFKTTVSNKSEDFLKNYTISGGDARLTINPKDVYFHVDGNGNTLGDVVYTVTDPNNPSSPDPINGQLVYGETVTPSYMPDGRLPNGHYGVSTSLPGYGPIDSGKVYGNYRYHYDSDITVNLPSKPDIVPPVNPPVTPGTGTVTPLPETPENTPNTPEDTTETTGHKTVWDGDRDRGGDRPEDKRVVTLPFFKVLEDKTTHRYGTYDVAKRTTEVKIAPSAQVLPEPNQPATQYRELDTELTTDKGTGEFTLKYNGSRFTILPDDDAATQLIVVGDETKNRDLFEKALHVAFTKMGLEVADLDGVYIHFGKE